MSKSSFQSGRPGSAGSKGSGSRKELINDRSCMLRIGERLMRAGSEGNLVHKTISNQKQLTSSGSGPKIGTIRLTRDADLQDQTNQGMGQYSSKDPGVLSDPPSSSRSTYRQQKQISTSSLQDYLSGGSPQHSGPSRDGLESLEKLIMKQCDVVKKKEALLEHLQKNNLHHATAFLSGPQLMKDQVRCLQSSDSLICSGVLGSEENILALETMWAGELPPPSTAFTRGCKARASLPMVHSSVQMREGKLNVLYLQHGEEIKQVQMSPEISSLDSIRTLFVRAFPHQLTLKMLQSPNMAVCIRDPGRNLYYDLEDLRSITPYSCLKVYHKDPPQAINCHGQPASADGRISKEVLYGDVSPAQSRGVLHSLQGSTTPPMVRSMPSSPSRIVYGGRRKVAEPGSATLPRERLMGAGSSTMSSSSGILERRDVKPDQSGTRSSLLLSRDTGLHHLHGLESSRSQGASTSVPAEVPGIPGGLHQYRASVRPLMDLETQNLHRQRTRSFSVETKTQPPSPHRVADLRRIDSPVVGRGGLASPEKTLLFQDSQWQDGNEVGMVNRRSGSSSSTSSVFVNSPLGQTENQLQNHVTTTDEHSNRMKAMEKQIASLAELVHQVLAFGVSAEAPDLMDSSSPASLALPAPPSSAGLQQGLDSVRRSMHELRLELSRLRSLQLWNLDNVSSMLRMAGQDLVLLIRDRLLQAQRTESRQRAEMEEDIARYLTKEERILMELRDLEKYVKCLQNPAHSPAQLSVSPTDMEEAAVNLRRAEEDLAVLRGEFPQLQVRVCSVLRLEMEAVRFLKEEPQKMEYMLKTARALTETLTSLRRCSAVPSQTAERPSPEGGVIKGTSSMNQNQSFGVPTPPASVALIPPASVAPTPLASAALTPPSSVAPTPPASEAPTPPASVGLTPPASVAPTPPASVAPTPPASEAPTPPASVGLTLPASVAPTSPASVAPTPPASEAPTPPASVGLTPPASVAPTPPASVAPTPLASAAPTPLASAAPTPLDSVAPPLLDSVAPPPLDSVAPPPLASAAHTPPSSIAPTPPSSSCMTRTSRPQVEKPHRSNMDVVRKKTPDLSSRSPPQRNQLAASSLTTGQIEEVVLICQKESTRAQEDGPRTVPHPKPPRHPEGKAPFQMCSSASGSIPESAAVLTPEEEEEDKDEKNSRFVKDLKKQVGRSSHGQKLEDKVVEGLPSVKLAAVGEVEMKPYHMMKTKNMERWTHPVAYEEHGLFVKQTDGHLLTPTTAVLHQQEENIRVLLDVEKVPLKGQTEERLSLPSEDGSTVSSSAFQQHKFVGSSQNQKPSTPVQKSVCIPSSPTYNPSRQQNQEDTCLLSTTGGSLNPTTGDEEEPPPPPPLTAKFIHRISKARMEEPDEGQGGSRTGVGLQNFAFEDRDKFITAPIILFLDDPVDLQAAYKRLSTILECDEDLQPSFMDEEDNTCEEADKRNPFISGGSQNPPQMQHEPPSGTHSLVHEDQGLAQTNPFTNTETKRKFGLRFPKSKLVEISQVIRMRTNKTIRKTAGSSIHEEQDEASRSEAQNLGRTIPSTDPRPTPCSWVQVLCRNTFDAISNLEESIKQLQLSMDSITTPQSLSSPQNQNSSFDPDGAQLQGKVPQRWERSPSRRLAIQTQAEQSYMKKAKTQCSQKTWRPSTRRQTSRSSSAQQHHIES